MAENDVGNVAAMREALVQCELFLSNVSRHAHPTLNPGDKCTACDDVDKLSGMVDRALATPPRNCDKYTNVEAAEAAWFYYKVSCPFPPGGWRDGDLLEWFLSQVEGGDKC